MAAHHQPRLAVLLFAFLAVHVHSTHGDPLPSTYDVSMCSDSFWCGGVEIHYPFYLANSTEATADHSGNFSCGYTDLSISCTLEGQTWTPTILLGGENYAVQSISYGHGHQTILLVDSDVLLGGGDCPAVRHEVSFNDTWLNNTRSNGNLTFFFGCDSVAPDFNAFKIKCAGFKSAPDAGPGDSFVFMAGELERYQVHELATNCSKVVTVPVRGDVLMAESNQSNFTSGGYGDVLKSGFELGWVSAVRGVERAMRL